MLGKACGVASVTTDQPEEKPRRDGDNLVRLGVLLDAGVALPDV